MKKFYDKGGSGGGGGRGRFDNRRDDRERPVMHQATCDDCGNDCEVPFRPSAGKPVFCKNCFNKGENNTSRERGGGSYDSRNADRRMYHARCDECGNDCEVPFRPSGDKPVYCNNCFGKNDSRHDSRNDSRGAKPSADHKAEFAQLNTKLDEVLKLLGDIIQPKKIVKRMKAEKKEKPAETEDKAESSEE